MKKPYLLICGDDYDSQWQKGNWIGCYEFESDALSAVKKKLSKNTCPLII